MLTVRHRNNAVDTVDRLGVSEEVGQLSQHALFTGWTSQAWNPGIANVQTGFGANPASYSIGTGNSFP
jgi:hypothetical protein